MKFKELILNELEKIYRKNIISENFWNEMIKRYPTCLQNFSNIFSVHLDFKFRFIPQKQYRIHISEEVNLLIAKDSDLQAKVLKVVEALKNGEDLKNFYSNSINNFTNKNGKKVFRDFLKNSLGIHHLHFGKNRPKGCSFLLVSIKENDAYIIDIATHEIFENGVGINKVFSILAKDFSDILREFVLVGIEGETLSDELISKCVMAGASFSIKTSVGAISLDKNYLQKTILKSIYISKICDEIEKFIERNFGKLPIGYFLQQNQIYFYFSDSIKYLLNSILKEEDISLVSDIVSELDLNI